MEATQEDKPKPSGFFVTVESIHQNVLTMKDDLSKVTGLPETVKSHGEEITKIKIQMAAYGVIIGLVTAVITVMITRGV